MENRKKGFENTGGKMTDFIKNVFCFSDFQNIEYYCGSKMAQYLEIVNKLRIYFDSFYESYIFESERNFNGLLKIEEVKKMLNYKDLRSTINWCGQHHVFVIQQGNSKFVCKSEFMLAFQKPYIEHLKSRFENWQEKFADYMESNYARLLEANNSSTKLMNQNFSSSYKPQSEIEKSFLKNMKEL